MVKVREQDIATLSLGLQQGKFTSVELTTAYLERMAFFSTPPFNVNAVVLVNPDALAEAETLDGERQHGHVRGPLHGIPILVKDNIDVAGLPTTAGALALTNNVATQDAELIQKLREAGAIILGKTNLSEFAHFKSDIEPSGFSVVGGQTINAIFPDLTPSGSSSGSGVAASLSLAAVTIGTETNGSILAPAQANSVVGLKPTVGAWPVVGILPLAHSQDAPGPIGRTVADVATVWQALGGATTASVSGVTVLQPDETDVLAQHVVNQMMANLTSFTFKRYDAVLPPSDEAAEYQRLLFEFKHDLDEYLQERGRNQSLTDIIAYNNADLATRAPFGQNLLLAAEATTGDLSSPVYQDVDRRARNYATTSLEKLLTASDVVVGADFRLVDFAAVAGYPSISIPFGQFGDVTFGGLASIIAVARPHEEAKLLTFARAAEEIGQRVIPSLGEESETMAWQRD
ncbi:amidase family protein [Weissella cibaria]|uniref:amidase family protein n=1 Tax=Weissella cibaria TaxID=137591 RepID=UPI00136ED977|nr:amidase family protein [Weissella cibaria]